jgi:DNA-binding NarL/FixJ family response regulator
MPILSVVFGEIMASDRNFQVSTPLIVEADAAVGPASSGRAQAVLVIATRHEITAAGIESILHAADYRVAARCSSEDDLARCLETYSPNIIMLAENVVGREGSRSVSRLREGNRSVATILLLGEHDEITASDLLELDVEGILLSGASVASLIDCVRSVHHGRKWIDPELLRQFAAGRPFQIRNNLTSREAAIAQLVSRGWNNKQIARELNLSEGTVKMHLHNIYTKLPVSGRTQLALSMASICAAKV